MIMSLPLMEIFLTNKFKVMKNQLRVLNISLTALILCLGLLYFLESKHELKKQIPVSYPEEISEAKVGDLLIVESVSDSIYLGFKHNLKN